MYVELGSFYAMQSPSSCRLGGLSHLQPCLRQARKRQIGRLKRQRGRHRRGAGSGGHLDLCRTLVTFVLVGNGNLLDS